MHFLRYTFSQPLIPPLTSMRCPLIQRPSSLHRKATTPPMSSAVPTLPNGDKDANRSFICGLLRIAALLKSVSIGPGATTLARIPFGPSSFAQYFVNTSMAPFIEAYTEYPGLAKRVVPLEMLTMLPPLAR